MLSWNQALLLGMLFTVIHVSCRVSLRKLFNRPIDMDLIIDTSIRSIIVFATMKLLAGRGLAKMPPLWENAFKDPNSLSKVTLLMLVWALLWGLLFECMGW